MENILYSERVRAFRYSWGLNITEKYLKIPQSSGVKQIPNVGWIVCKLKVNKIYPPKVALIILAPDPYKCFGAGAGILSCHIKVWNLG
jgi:hypothetical protein